MNVNVKVYDDFIPGLIQIHFSSPDTERRSWISRFKGDRTWSIHLKTPHSTDAYRLESGEKTHFLRNIAERAAIEYVTLGKECI